MSFTVLVGFFRASSDKENIVYPPLEARRIHEDPGTRQGKHRQREQKWRTRHKVFLTILGSSQV